MNTMVARKGNWMQTYSGKQFYPIDPRPEEIDLLDIAHALGMLCRFGGHCNRFYSVAEHCYHISMAVPSELALWGLMHDATEAYCTDIVRPLKRHLTNYAEIEDRILRTLAERFGLKLPIPKEVKDADNRILKDERDQNMKPPFADWTLDFDEDKPGLGVTLQFWSPEMAAAHWLGRAHYLLGDIR